MRISIETRKRTVSFSLNFKAVFSNKLKPTRHATPKCGKNRPCLTHDGPPKYDERWQEELLAITERQYAHDYGNRRDHAGL